jgi:hypothetical protein
LSKSAKLIMDIEQDRPLLVAEAHIIRGERMISRQMMLVERLRNHGHPTLDAERVLSVLEDSLRQFYRDREVCLTHPRRLREVSTVP